MFKILIILTAVLTFCESTMPAPSHLMVADAMDASVTSDRVSTIADNYGDPEDFVKYIIRKPPAFA